MSLRQEENAEGEICEGDEGEECEYGGEAEGGDREGEELDHQEDGGEAEEGGDVGGKPADTSGTQLT